MSGSQPGAEIQGSRCGSRILVRRSAEFGPQGGVEPKICSKVPENCTIVKNLGGRGGG